MLINLGAEIEKFRVSPVLIRDTLRESILARINFP